MSLTCRVSFIPASFKKYLLLLLLAGVAPNLFAQDTSFHPKHKAIYFPYPMYKEKWRSSIGFNLVATPEDITEEVRIRIPTLDYHALRRISDHVIIDTRWYSQIVQNLFQLGPHWRTPLSKDLYVDAGTDLGYWFGFLKVGGFNSSASGWQDKINLSLGYKTKKELLITLKGELSYNLYYKAKNGENDYSSDRKYYNGGILTIALEQPFYNHKHITLAFSGIRNRFNWQTWSLFYKTDRKIFYPQITVGFIL
jgi:hypothetical protein